MDDLKKEFRSRVLAYIGGAFGLVAGLAWNEAIQELIRTLFPVARNSIAVKFLYAVIVTAVVVVVISYLEKIFRRD